MMPQHLLLSFVCAFPLAFVSNFSGLEPSSLRDFNHPTLSLRNSNRCHSRTTKTVLFYNINRDRHSLTAARKIREAELVEEVLSQSLHEARITHYTDKRSTPPTFPCVKQCNAAIATFGDSGDFRRALKLFTEMRKSESIIKRISRSSNQTLTPENDSNSKWNEESKLNDKNSASSRLDMVDDPPAPTLVTYTTLISRAVSVGKPRVAIRLFNLMKNQPTFYTNVISRKQRQGRISDPSVFLNPAELRKLEVEHDAIVPDVIFCNTLMNAYAKLGDHKMARFILNSMLGTAKSGDIVLHEIPRVSPTIISFNTLIDACKEAGDLGAGLEVLELMSYHVAPDARTFTTLISTVARKAKLQGETRDVRSGGERDPDKAFELLHEMQARGIKPNGATYCALIDVCGRCRRVDLALSGLRLMLSEKKAENRNKPLVNEVGAWTAAITATGKNGRIDTALRLFDAMKSQFSVSPNIVTCGSLTDSLVKAGRIPEAVQVLQYMQTEGIVPGQVMYTSLMSSALELAERDNDEVLVDGVQVKVIDRVVSAEKNTPEMQNSTKTNSILLYTELMRSMMVTAGKDSSGEDVLLKVFLTFQEMRAVGVTPDLACYNTLLKACSYAGDATKSQEILKRMNEDGIQPNRRSYIEALRAAASDGRSDIADLVWDEASRSSKNTYGIGFVPRAIDFEVLITAYVNEMQKSSDHIFRMKMHRKIINAFEEVQSQSLERGMNHIPLEEIEQNQHLLLTILRSAVSVALIPRKGDKNVKNEDVKERIRARYLASQLTDLEVMKKGLSHSINGKTKKAFNLAREWLYSD